MKILVSGFAPFLGESINPSGMIARSLAESFPQVRAKLLPVEFGKSFEVLSAVINGEKFDYVLMLGQAAGRSRISFEKIALNWVQSEHRDEGGVLPPTGSISAGAPLASLSVFPVDEVYQQLKSSGHPVEISFSAGAYVCNDLYFRVRESFPGLKAVFIHVPLIEEQIQPGAPRPFLPLAEQLGTLKEVVGILSRS